MDTEVKLFLEEIESKCKGHKEWVRVFKNCFYNTLKKAMMEDNKGRVFVLTGDIPAMWLRDSTAQIRPYIFLAKKSKNIMRKLLGVIDLQISYILHDAYANAFNQNASKKGHKSTDITKMTPFIWERKYELDSLCYPMQLAYLLYKNTGETQQFDIDFYSAVLRIIEVWKIEQRHENSEYTFIRNTDRKWDTLVNEGRGVKCAYTGMTWSGFRPSDDHCEYNYLIPSNMFAVVVLGYMAEIVRDIYNDKDLENRIWKLRTEINEGIQKYAIVDSASGKKVYAYEVDGLGNYKIMDDANIPSLLSIPYLGYEYDTEIYQNTMEVIFSKENPYYYKGKEIYGIGSSHTWENYIWHLSMAMEGLVCKDKKVKESILNQMVCTDGDTGFMHESFDVNNPKKYTREWFSWPNMLFCELVLSYFGYELRR